MTEADEQPLQPGAHHVALDDKPLSVLPLPDAAAGHAQLRMEEEDDSGLAQFLAATASVRVRAEQQAPLTTAALDRIASSGAGSVMDLLGTEGSDQHSDVGSMQKVTDLMSAALQEGSLKEAINILRALGTRRTYENWRAELHAWEEAHGVVLPESVFEGLGTGGEGTGGLGPGASPARSPAPARVRVYVPPDPRLPILGQRPIVAGSPTVGRSFMERSASSGKGDRPAGSQGNGQFSGGPLLAPAVSLGQSRSAGNLPPGSPLLSQQHQHAQSTTRVGGGASSSGAPTSAAVTPHLGPARSEALSTAASTIYYSLPHSLAGEFASRAVSGMCGQEGEEDEEFLSMLGDEVPVITLSAAPTSALSEALPEGIELRGEGHDEGEGDSGSPNSLMGRVLRAAVAAVEEATATAAAVAAAIAVVDDLSASTGEMISRAEAAGVRVVPPAPPTALPPADDSTPQLSSKKQVAADPATPIASKPRRTHRRAAQQQLQGPGVSAGQADKQGHVCASLQVVNSATGEVYIPPANAAQHPQRLLQAILHVEAHSHEEQILHAQQGPVDVTCHGTSEPAAAQHNHVQGQHSLPGSHEQHERELRLTLVYFTPDSQQGVQCVGVRLEPACRSRNDVAAGQEAVGRGVQAADCIANSGSDSSSSRGEAHVRLVLLPVEQQEGSHEFPFSRSYQQVQEGGGSGQWCVRLGLTVQQLTLTDPGAEQSGMPAWDQVQQGSDTEGSMSERAGTPPEPPRLPVLVDDLFGPLFEPQPLQPDEAAAAEGDDPADILESAFGLRLVAALRSMSLGVAGHKGGHRHGQRTGNRAAVYVGGITNLAASIPPPDPLEDLSYEEAVQVAARALEAAAARAGAVAEPSPEDARAAAALLEALRQGLFRDLVSDLLDRQEEEGSGEQPWWSGVDSHISDQAGGQGSPGPALGAPGDAIANPAQGAVPSAPLFGDLVADVLSTPGFKHKLPASQHATPGSSHRKPRVRPPSMIEQHEQEVIARHWAWVAELEARAAAEAAAKAEAEAAARAAAEARAAEEAAARAAATAEAEAQRQREEEEAARAAAEAALQRRIQEEEAAARVLIQELVEEAITSAAQAVQVQEQDDDITFVTASAGHPAIIAQLSEVAAFADEEPLLDTVEPAADAAQHTQRHPVDTDSAAVSSGDQPQATQAPVEEDAELSALQLFLSGSGAAATAPHLPGTVTQASTSILDSLQDSAGSPAAPGTPLSPPPAATAPSSALSAELQDSAISAQAAGSHGSGDVVSRGSTAALIAHPPSSPISAVHSAGADGAARSQYPRAGLALLGHELGGVTATSDDDDDEEEGTLMSIRGTSGSGPSSRPAASQQWSHGAAAQASSPGAGLLEVLSGGASPASRALNRAASAARAAYHQVGPPPGSPPLLSRHTSQQELVSSPDGSSRGPSASGNEPAHSAVAAIPAGAVVSAQGAPPSRGHEHSAGSDVRSSSSGGKGLSAADLLAAWEAGLATQSGQQHPLEPVAASPPHEEGDRQHAQPDSPRQHSDLDDLGWGDWQQPGAEISSPLPANTTQATTPSVEPVDSGAVGGQREGGQEQHCGEEDEDDWTKQLGPEASSAPPAATPEQLEAALARMLSAGIAAPLALKQATPEVVRRARAAAEGSSSKAATLLQPVMSSPGAHTQHIASPSVTSSPVPAGSNKAQQQLDPARAAALQQYLAARQAEAAAAGGSPGAFQDLVTELTGMTPSKDSTRQRHQPLAGHKRLVQSPVQSTGASTREATATPTRPSGPALFNPRVWVPAPPPPLALSSDSEEEDQSEEEEEQGHKKALVPVSSHQHLSGTQHSTSSRRKGSSSAKSASGAAGGPPDTSHLDLGLPLEVVDKAQLVQELRTHRSHSHHLHPRTSRQDQATEGQPVGTQEQGQADAGALVADGGEEAAYPGNQHEAAELEPAADRNGIPKRTAAVKHATDLEVFQQPQVTLPAVAPEEWLSEFKTASAAASSAAAVASWMPPGMRGGNSISASSATAAKSMTSPSQPHHSHSRVVANSSAAPSSAHHTTPLWIKLAQPASEDITGRVPLQSTRRAEPPVSAGAHSSPAGAGTPGAADVVDLLDAPHSASAAPIATSTGAGISGPDSPAALRDLDPLHSYVSPSSGRPLPGAQPMRPGSQTRLALHVWSQHQPLTSPAGSARRTKAAHSRLSKPHTEQGGSPANGSATAAAGLHSANHTNPHGQAAPLSEEEFSVVPDPMPAQAGITTTQAGRHAAAPAGATKAAGHSPALANPAGYMMYTNGAPGASPAGVHYIPVVLHPGSLPAGYAASPQQAVLVASPGNPGHYMQVPLQYVLSVGGHSLPPGASPAASYVSWASAASKPGTASVQATPLGDSFASPGAGGYMSAHSSLPGSTWNSGVREGGRSASASKPPLGTAAAPSVNLSVGAGVDVEGGAGPARRLF